MARYSNTIRNQYAQPVEAASVYVYTAQGDKVTLEADGGGALDNPVATDEYGNFYFNADDGLYTLAVHFAGREIYQQNYVQVGSGPTLPTEILVALGNPAGSSLIGYTAPYDEAVPEDTKSALDRLPIFIESFRAPGNTDRQVLAKALDAWEAKGGGTLVGGGPGVTYALGTVAAVEGGAVLFSVSGLRNAVLDWAGSKITMTTADAAPGGVNVPYFLIFYDYQNVEIRNLGGFTDSGSVKTFMFQGAWAFASNSDNGACQGITFDNVRIDRAIGAFAAFGDLDTRISGITITRSCHFSNVYYGAALQENGDNAILEYVIEDCVRAGIAYGVSNVQLDLAITGMATQIGEGAFVFMRKLRDAYGLTGRMTFNGSLDQWHTGGAAPGYLLGLQQQNDDGADALLGGVDVEIVIEPGTQDTLGVQRLRYSSFSLAGVENTGATDHVFGPVTIGGALANIPTPFKTRCTPDVKPMISIRNGTTGLGPSPTSGVPGFPIQVALGHYVAAKSGDLTTGTIVIPAQGLLDTIGLIEVTIAATADVAAISHEAASKAHVFQDIVGMYNLIGTCSTLAGTPIAVAAAAFNSSNLTRAYAGDVDGNLVITLGGSHYTGPNASARIEAKAYLGSMAL